MARRSGDALLYEFITRNRISWARAGRDLGVSAVAVMQWALGRAVPTREHQEAIETWTSGAVPVSSWPRRDVARVKPFKATGS